LYQKVNGEIYNATLGFEVAGVWCARVSGMMRFQIVIIVGKPKELSLLVLRRFLRNHFLYLIFPFFCLDTKETKNQGQPEASGRLSGLPTSAD
jgi:hypothetical protein